VRLVSVVYATGPRSTIIKFQKYIQNMSYKLTKKLDPIIGNNIA